MRGGFRVPTSGIVTRFRPIGSIPSFARTAVNTYRNLPQPIKTFAERKGKEFLRSAGKHAENFGLQIVKMAFENTPDRSLKPLPMKGSEIASISQTVQTETNFKAHVVNHHSSKLKAAISAAQTFEWKTIQYYGCNAGTNSQNWVDLCTVGTNPGSTTTDPQTNYAYSNAFYNGDYGTGIGSPVPRQNGSLSTQLNMLQGIAPSDSINQSGTANIFFKDCENIMTITNGQSSAVYIDLYEVVAKHDFAPMPGNQLLFGDNYALVYSPGNMWQVDLVQNYNLPYNVPTATTGGLLTALNTGCQPTDSILFNNYWKVDFHTTISLSAYSTHIHKSVYGLNRIINQVRYQNASLIQGVTRSILLVIRGLAAVYGTGTDSAASEIVVTNDITYRFAGLPYSTASTYYTTTS